MTRILSILFFFLFPVAGFSQGYQWTKTFGAGSVDEAHAICIDQSGNILITGYFKDSVDFDPGSGVSIHSSAGGIDIYVLKLDSLGNFLWVKTAGGPGNDFGTSIITDGAGDIFIYGAFSDSLYFDPGNGNSYHISQGSYDCFLMKLNNAGNFISVLTFGGAGLEGPGNITIDFSGNVLLSGNFESSIVDFNPGNGVDNKNNNGSFDAFILKLNNSGNYIWTKTFGGSGVEDATSLIVDSGNNIYTTGYFEDTVDFDPGVGIQIFTTAGLSDAYILKLNSAGDFIWNLKSGSPGIDNGNDLVADNNGYVYVIGTFNGTIDLNPGNGIDIHTPDSSGVGSYIQKIDTAGNFIWANSISSTGNIQTQSIATDLQGNIFTTGYFQGVMDFDPGNGIDIHSTSTPASMFIQKYNGSGNVIFTKTLAGSGLAYEIALDGNKIYTCGRFSGGYDFNPDAGTDLHSSNGQLDAFVWKYLDTTVSLNETPGNFNYNFYPNPCGDEIAVAAKGIPDGKYFFNIIDVEGKIIFSEEVNVTDNNLSVEINMSDQGAGCYLISIKSTDKMYFHKILKINLE